MTHEQTVVKLTDAQRQTGAAYGAPLQWGPGVTHEVAEWSGELCTTGVLHAYSAGMLRDAVALAVLMDSTHGGYGADARLWVCSAEGRSVSDGTKSGHTRLTTLRELPLPKVTIDQRVEVAIRCAQQSPGQTNEWTTWAAAWLDGTGRSAWAAADAAWAAAADAARADAAADAAAVAARAVASRAAERQQQVADLVALLERR